MIDELATFTRIGPAPTERPWVVISMIASVDGATALDGRSGGLGNATDRAVLHAVRAAADVVLVGASTVRTERYRPLPPPKRLVIVSASGELGEAGGVLDAPNTELVTPTAGDDDGASPLVDLGALLGRFAGRVVVSEGGPSLNGQLLAAGLVDEVFVTLSPRLVAGSSARLAHGPMSADAAPWELRHLLSDTEGYVLLRYRTRRSSSGSTRSSATSS